ncbi:amidase signature domain-containing protein [Truncatella angustata]|uniref:Amidase signature domain-containing protein n=1 Tax=Truncatella angustata TaxID=152316 RepID=A0A9P8ZYH7_9PEZI|nr:amidase signature domain-containing protein [Truncatella angustata]KAH6654050.1 amidase signature domain-containing protein [Truncatella angustata]
MAVKASVWQDIVSKKRDIQFTAINSFRSGTSQVNQSVCENPNIDDLLELYHSGDVNIEQVIRSYIASAISAHKKTNCLTEVLFEHAIESAKALDANGEPSPLRGVPMTLKDQFNVQGFDSTIGYVGRALRPARNDAILVEMLRGLGAVILAKTNLPQSIMWCETENPLWGLTTNPSAPGYTPGGSTGGESALLALKGTMVGWGTDIGGSIRIPSHMMGLYGLKPSSSRLPYTGVPVSTEGQEHVPSSVGPMARSLSSITHVMKSLIDAQPWKYDARCAPIPWRHDIYDSSVSRPLTIGVLFDDGVVRPHPPITRVLKSAVEALRKAGHDIMEWDASLHPECIEVMDTFYSADGGEDVRTDVEAGGEPYIPHVERLVNRGKAISVYEYWQLNKKKWALQQAYLEKWKRMTSPATGRNADVIIMPPMPHASVPHGGCRWVGYTKVFNVLDYSALVIPGGDIKQEDTETSWEFEPRNEMDEWNMQLWRKHREEMVKLRLPVGVQIIARKLEEEKVLAVGKVLDDLLRCTSP